MPPAFEKHTAALHGGRAAQGRAGSHLDAHCPSQAACTLRPRQAHPPGLPTGPGLCRLFTEVMTGLSGAHHIDTDYIMTDALYEYPPEHFSAVLGRVQQYLTIHIFQIEELDEEVCSRVFHLAPMVACWGYAGAQPPAQRELDCAQCLLACRPVLRLVQPMVCTRFSLNPKPLILNLVGSLTRCFVFVARHSAAVGRTQGDRSGCLQCQTVGEVLKILFEVNEMSGAVPITEFYNGACEPLLWCCTLEWIGDLCSAVCGAAE